MGSIPSSLPAVNFSKKINCLKPLQHSLLLLGLMALQAPAIAASCKNLLNVKGVCQQGAISVTRSQTSTTPDVFKISEKNPLNTVELIFSDTSANPIINLDFELNKVDLNFNDPQTTLNESQHTFQVKEAVIANEDPINGKTKFTNVRQNFTGDTLSLSQSGFFTGVTQEISVDELNWKVNLLPSQDITDLTQNLNDTKNINLTINGNDKFHNVAQNITADSAEMLVTSSVPLTSGDLKGLIQTVNVKNFKFGVTSAGTTGSSKNLNQTFIKEDSVVTLGGTISDGSQSFNENVNLTIDDSANINGAAAAPFTQIFAKDAKIDARPGSKFKAVEQHFDSDQPTLTLTGNFDGVSQIFQKGAILAGSTKNIKQIFKNDAEVLISGNIKSGEQEFARDTVLTLDSTASLEGQVTAPFKQNFQGHATTITIQDGARVMDIAQTFSNANTVVNLEGDFNKEVDQTFVDGTHFITAKSDVKNVRQTFHAGITTLSGPFKGGKQTFLKDTNLILDPQVVLEGDTTNAFSQRFNENATITTQKGASFNNVLQTFKKANGIVNLEGDFNGLQQNFKKSVHVIAQGTGVENIHQTFDGDTVKLQGNFKGGQQSFKKVDLDLGAATLDQVEQHFFEEANLIGTSGQVITNGKLVLRGPDAKVSLDNRDLLSPNTAVHFSSAIHQPHIHANGTFMLNGVNTEVGRIQSDGLFDASTGGLIVNNNNNHAQLTVNTEALGDSTFSGQLGDKLKGSVTLGQLDLVKTGNNKLVLNGESAHAYSGVTRVQGGELVVNSDISSSSKVDVENGAILSGSGKASDVTIKQGGMLSPGNFDSPTSFTPFTVKGDLTFEEGSIYNVGVKQIAQDFYVGSTSVKGVVNINGAVIGRLTSKSNFVGMADLDKDYLILHADKGFNGTEFEPTLEMNGDFRYITPEISYTKQDVSLRLSRNDVPFSADATNPVELKATQDLDSAPEEHPISKKFAKSSNDSIEIREKIQALKSAEASAHVTPVLISNVVNITRSLPMARLHSSFSAPSRIAGAPIAQLESGTLSRAALPRTTSPLWLEGFGSWRKQDGDDGKSGLKQSTAGLFLGAETMSYADWKFGGALGFADTKIKMNDYDATTTVKSYSAALYGGRSIEHAYGNKTNLSLGAAYTWHDINSKRHLFDDQLKAKYGAHTAQIFGELGYAFAMGSAIVEPFIGVNFGNHAIRAFKEEGGDAALEGKSQDIGLANSTLGLRLQNQSMNFGKIDTQVRAMLGWRHAYGNVNPKSTIIGYSQTMQFEGLPLTRDTGVGELGLDFAMSPRTTVGMTYQTEMGKNLREHSANLNVQWKF